jgi:16S rRNA (adenine1518-N6/adenine1519-N6)-dimethyltransferase
VLAQLSCDVKVVRRVPPTVFHPAPKVESAIVSLRRHSPPPPREVVDLVHAGFAHRRKALPRALSLAPRPRPGIRDAARAALERMGHPPDARAERLQPHEFTRLAEELRR